MDMVIFYNNECIKLDHIMAHLLMQRGDELKCKIMKAVRFLYSYCNLKRIASFNSI